VAISGGYRKPREIYWWSVIAITLLLAAIAITGTLLPWDEQAYSRMAVEFGILRSVPGGDMLARLVAGGEDFGNLTVLRLFLLHAWVLPLALGVAFIVHQRQVRRHGYYMADGYTASGHAAGSPTAPGSVERRGSFLNQWLLYVGAMVLVSAVLVFLTVRSHGVELFAPAEVGSQFDTRPALYVRALNELLKYFDGPLLWVATMLVPGACAAFLVGLPWLDRSQSPRLSARLPVVSVSALIFAGYVVLTGMNVMRDQGDQEYAKSMDQANKLAQRARSLALKGVLPAGGDAVYENDPKVAVRRLFKEECQTCHMIGGIGGQEGPDFTDYKSREYLAAMTRNIMDVRFFGCTKHKGMEGAMEPYPEEDLSNEDLKAVVEYTYALMGSVAQNVDQSLAKKGEQVFDDECSTCHEVKPGEAGDGPNLFGHGSRDWLIAVIKDSSKPTLFGTMAQMPKYEGKLTDQQIADLADFILQEGPNAPKPAGGT
jgi:ubiquinol-cytochrome c reductase cytochrome b subunit